MPRLLGVDIPNDKSTVVSLTYLYGVGPKTSRALCHAAGITPEKKARAKDAGATGWIVKPFDAAKLTAALRRVAH